MADRLLLAFLFLLVLQYVVGLNEPDCRKQKCHVEQDGTCGLGDEADFHCGLKNDDETHLVSMREYCLKTMLVHEGMCRMGGRPLCDRKSFCDFDKSPPVKQQFWRKDECVSVSRTENAATSHLLVQTLAKFCKMFISTCAATLCKPNAETCTYEDSTSRCHIKVGDENHRVLVSEYCAAAMRIHEGVCTLRHPLCDITTFCEFDQSSTSGVKSSFNNNDLCMQVSKTDIKVVTLGQFCTNLNPPCESSLCKPEGHICMHDDESALCHLEISGHTKASVWIQDYCSAVMRVSEGQCKPARPLCDETLFCDFRESPPVKSDVSSEEECASWRPDSSSVNVRTLAKYCEISIPTCDASACQPYIMKPTLKESALDADAVDDLSPLKIGCRKGGSRSEQCKTSTGESTSYKKFCKTFVLPVRHTFQAGLDVQTDVTCHAKDDVEPLESCESRNCVQDERAETSSCTSGSVFEGSPFCELSLGDNREIQEVVLFNDFCRHLVSTSHDCKAQTIQKCDDSAVMNVDGCELTWSGDPSEVCYDARENMYKRTETFFTPTILESLIKTRVPACLVEDCKPIESSSGWQCHSESLHCCSSDDRVETSASFCQRGTVAVQEKKTEEIGFVRRFIHRERPQVDHVCGASALKCDEDLTCFWPTRFSRFFNEVRAEWPGLFCYDQKKRSLDNKKVGVFSKVKAEQYCTNLAAQNRPAKM